MTAGTTVAMRVTAEVVLTIHNIGTTFPLTESNCCLL